MKNVVSFMCATSSIAFVASGCYGFINDLSLCGLPMLFSVAMAVLSRIFLLEN